MRLHFECLDQGLPLSAPVQMEDAMLVWKGGLPIQQRLTAGRACGMETITSEGADTIALSRIAGLYMSLGFRAV